MRIELVKRNAIVTGGSHGIGKATAGALEQCGARVWVFDLDAEGPSHVRTDVSDPASLENAFAQSGAPDILVINAGIAPFGTLLEHTREQWDRTIGINLSGAFHTLHAAARLMIPRRSGAIVFTASTNSYDGEAGQIAYNASKAGLLGLVHSAANELGPYGIRVNAVCPGMIRTRLTESIYDQPEVLKPYFKNLPLGRGGEPQEVAAAIAFLASDLASYITGATLMVDGGQMAAKFGAWSEDSAEFVDGRWKLC